MNRDTDGEVIELVPDQLVEIVCEAINLTGIPDEDFAPIVEADPEAIVICPPDQIGQAPATADSLSPAKSV